MDPFLGVLGALGGSVFWQRSGNLKADWMEG